MFNTALILVGSLACSIVSHQPAPDRGSVNSPDATVPALRNEFKTIPTIEAIPDRESVPRRLADANGGMERHGFSSFPSQANAIRIQRAELPESGLELLDWVFHDTNFVAGGTTALPSR